MCVFRDCGASVVINYAPFEWLFDARPIVRAFLEPYIPNGSSYGEQLIRVYHEHLCLSAISWLDENLNATEHKFCVSIVGPLTPLLAFLSYSCSQNTEFWPILHPDGQSSKIRNTRSIVVDTDKDVKLRSPGTSVFILFFQAVGSHVLDVGLRRPLLAPLSKINPAAAEALQSIVEQIIARARSLLIRYFLSTFSRYLPW